MKHMSFTVKGLTERGAVDYMAKRQGSKQTAEKGN
jgi:hypothetical protein